MTLTDVCSLFVQDRKTEIDYFYFSPLPSLVSEVRLRERESSALHRCIPFIYSQVTDLGSLDTNKNTTKDVVYNI